MNVVPAQEGSFSFGIQSAKSTEAVLDSDAIKAAFNVYGQTLPYSVTGLGAPAVASRIAFTVTAALGAGDATFEVEGSLGGEGVYSVVVIPPNAVIGTRVWTGEMFDTLTAIRLVEQSTGTGAVEIGANTGSTGAVASWFRYKANDINFGIVEDVRTAPLEVGDDMTPTGGYKAGSFVGGGATLSPRMEGDFGWMLKALMGAVQTSGNAANGYTHVFKFAAPQSSIPWCGARKFIPGDVPLGELGKDCKVASVRLNVPQTGLVQARVDFSGREGELEEQPNWTFADVYEEIESVPLSCRTAGFVKFPANGSGWPIQNLIITMINNLSSPQQVAVVGSPHPRDIVVLSRAMTIQATLLYEVPDLYELMLTGQTLAGILPWSSSVYTTTFQAKVEAPADIPNTSPVKKYTLQIDAEKVMWQPNGSPVLAGGDLVLLPLLGTVMRPPSGDYCKFTVLNGQSAY